VEPRAHLLTRIGGLSGGGRTGVLMLLLSIDEREGRENEEGEGVEQLPLGGRGMVALSHHPVDGLPGAASRRDTMGLGDAADAPDRIPWAANGLWKSVGALGINGGWGWAMGGTRDVVRDLVDSESSGWAQVPFYGVGGLGRPPNGAAPPTERDAGGVGAHKRKLPIAPRARQGIDPLERRKPQRGGYLPQQRIAKALTQGRGPSPVGSYRESIPSQLPKSSPKTVMPNALRPRPLDLDSPS